MAGRAWIPVEARTICPVEAAPLFADRKDARKGLRLERQRRHERRSLWALWPCWAGLHWHIGRRSVA